MQHVSRQHKLIYHLEKTNLTLKAWPRFGRVCAPNILDSFRKETVGMPLAAFRGKPNKELKMNQLSNADEAFIM